jgi:hypothetical protein
VALAGLARAGANKLLALLAVALSVLCGALTIARLPAAWESGNALNHVSGAWMALADDLARGTFYRPLQDPALGWGGTRAFPLAFALHAALLRAGVPLLPAGFALSAAAGLLAVLGVGLLLRRAGLGHGAAAALAPLALAGFAGQHAIAAIRGDLLAVALQALALGLVVGPALSARPSTPPALPAPSSPVALASLLLALAFAVKPTALTALAPAALLLLLRGDRRAAVRLALLTGAGAAAVIAATELLSGGRFLALMRACGGGGAGPADLVRAPLRLALLLAVEDRAGLVLLGAAAVALAATAPRTLGGWRAPGSAGVLLASLWLLAAGAGLLAVLASPGTGVNHLLELEVACAVALGTCAAPHLERHSNWHAQSEPLALLGRLAAPAAAAAGVVLALTIWRDDLRSSRLAEIRAAIAVLPRGAGPVLSEDPLVPLLAGQRPLSADTWMLRLAGARDPELLRPLLRALAAGRITAVVLLQDAMGPEASSWYAGNLGAEALAEVRRSYRLAARAGRYRVYRFAPTTGSAAGRSNPDPARRPDPVGAECVRAASTSRSGPRGSPERPGEERGLPHELDVRAQVPREGGTRQQRERPLQFLVADAGDGLVRGRDEIAERRDEALGGKVVHGATACPGLHAPSGLAFAIPQ